MRDTLNEQVVATVALVVETIIDASIGVEGLLFEFRNYRHDIIRY
jgi:hypothetical protein